MEKISHYCDISIHFDSGRSFLYLNDEFINDYKLGLKRSLKVHFSHSDYYYKALNQNKLVPPNYVMFCFANNYNDIINCLSLNYLSKESINNKVLMKKIYVKHKTIYLLYKNIERKIKLNNNNNNRFIIKYKKNLYIKYKKNKKIKISKSTLIILKKKYRKYNK